MPSALRGDLLTIGDRARASAQPVAVEVLAAGAQRITTAARAVWPVKTGRSKAALQALVEGRAVVIRDSVGYATSIVSHGVNPWDAYILAPARQFVSTEAPKAIATALVAALRSRRG